MADAKKVVTKAAGAAGPAGKAVNAAAKVNENRKEHSANKDKLARSYSQKNKKSVPPSEAAQKSNEAVARRQKRKDALEGLAFQSAKRFSERHYRRVLIAEFLASTTLIIADELMKDDFQDTPNLKPLVAVFIVYFVLAAGTTFGTGPSRLSANFGGLVTLAILMKFLKDTSYKDDKGQIHSKVTDFFQNTTNTLVS